MRKIDTQNFQRATRDTPRTVNRRIILNLVRDEGPLSRADLARSMNVPRGMITSLVNELLAEGLIFEGATTAAPRGRRPTLLHLRSKNRLAVGVDVQGTRTDVQLSDFGGAQLAQVSIPTPELPEAFVDALAQRVRQLVEESGDVGTCEGVGVVVPGMVDERSGVLLNAPALGWNNVDIKGPLAERLELPVHVERDAVACAMARIWLGGQANGELRDFVYLLVSEGVGTGVVVNGQPVRGRHSAAGEFGHVPLNFRGPACTCGGRGCLEAYTSNPATLARYFRRQFSGRATTTAMREAGMTVRDLATRAGNGDARAREAIAATGRFLGIGLAGIINALNPARVVLAGDITAAWELLEPILRAEVAERALTEAAAGTPVVVDPDHAGTRLRGAAALVVAPAFAAPTIA